MTRTLHPVRTEEEEVARLRLDLAASEDLVDYLRQQARDAERMHQEALERESVLRAQLANSEELRSEDVDELELVRDRLSVAGARASEAERTVRRMTRRQWANEQIKIWGLNSRWVQEKVLPMLRRRKK